MITFNGLANALYLDERYWLMALLEENGDPKEMAYVDSVGIPTIGVGFNLEASAVRNEILVGLGFNHSVTVNAEGVRSVTFDGLEQIYVDRIIAIAEGNWTGNITGLRTALNQVMNDRADDIRIVSTNEQPKRTAFEFTDDAEIRAVFDNIAPTYERAITTRTPNTPNSLERLALFSLAYNNPALIGPNLQNAIATGNRVGAWFEIRYQSNGGGSGGAGIAKRRYLEAQLFGLFDNPASVSAVEAQEVITFLNSPLNATQTRLEYLISYETTYWQNAGAAIRDYGLTGTPLQQIYLQDVLRPIAPHLINHYLDGENTGIVGSNYSFDGDVILGFVGGNGIIDSRGKGSFTGPEGVLYVDKNDLLIAIDNDINNSLEGGKGNDFLIGAAKNDTLKGGEGNDVLVGKDGVDTLEGGDGYDYLLGGKGNDTLTGGKGDDFLEGGADNDTYIFDGEFGRDTLEDGSGNNTLKINNTTLANFEQVDGADIIYRDNKNNPNFEAIKINEGDSTSLLITLLGENNGSGSLLIKNWSEGQFGLNLAEAQPQEPTGTMAVVNGNGSDNMLSFDNIRDTNNQAEIAQYTGLQIDGKDGNDLILGELDTNDHLLGGAGNDIIWGGSMATINNVRGAVGYSATGMDDIDGGAGNDWIFAASGTGTVARGGDDADVLHANYSGFMSSFNIAELQTVDAQGVTQTLHGAITRDQVWADVRSVSTFDLNNTSTATEFSPLKLVEINQAYPSASNTPFMFYDEPLWSAAVQMSYNMKQAENGEYYQQAPSTPFSFALYETKTFLPGQTLQNSANVKGVNFYGDAGTDWLYGGLYSDYLSGGTEGDVLWGYEGNDVLDGGEHEDVLKGGAGNDILIGGDGNDKLWGAEGELFADSIALSPDNNLLYGGKGDDELTGGAGKDYLDGGIGKDKLWGGDGNDTIVLDEDDYFAVGGEGDDIFIMEKVIYTDENPPPINNNNIVINTATIADTAGNNTIAFEGVQGFGDVSVRVNESDVLITTANGQAVIIQNGASGAPVDVVLGNSVEELASRQQQYVALSDNNFLKNGNSLLTSQTNLTFLMLNKVADVVVSNAASANTYLAGGLVADRLGAHEDGSTLIGGVGDDSLLGEEGGDTYLYRVGDGDDTIYELNGEDRIKLGEGITADQVTLTRDDYNHMRIEFSTGGSIQVENAFNSSGDFTLAAVEAIEFIDGTVWDLERIKAEALANAGPVQPGQTINGTANADSLSGSSGNDTLTGGTGDDSLSGGNGNDVYQFDIGDGVDSIGETGGFDTIKFGLGVTRNNIQLAIMSSDLYIQYGNSDRVIRRSVQNYDTGGVFADRMIERIEFSDGSFLVLDDATISSYSNVPWHNAALNGNAYYGYYTNDVFAGSDLADTIFAERGDDIIHGGKGNDRLYGDYGNDIYKFNNGGGDDVIIEDRPGYIAATGLDTIEFGEGISQNQIDIRRDGNNAVISLGNGDSVTVQNMLHWSNNTIRPDEAIEKITFFDGTIWDQQRISAEIFKTKVGITLTGSVGNDTLVGASLDDTLSGGNLDDILLGGNGFDTLNGDDGNDHLYGELHRDILHGGAGNDFLQGGKDDDSHNGGTGNDIYYFEQGDGVDVITEVAGEDTIRFGSGIASADLDIKIISGENIRINYGDNATMTIANILDHTGRLNVDKAIEYIEFSNNESWSAQQLLEHINFSGSSGDDNIYALAGDITLAGENGNDSLEGRDGNNILDGGSGNDSLRDTQGNNTFIGGLGDDTIYSGVSTYLNNIINFYHYHLGDGNDKYYGTKTNTIIFGADITPDDLRIYDASGNNRYLIRIGDEGSIDVDSIYVNVEFENESSLSLMNFLLNSMQGDDEDNYITIPTNFTTYLAIDAGAGNDTIEIVEGAQSGDVNAGDGNDKIISKSTSVLTFNGGKGNDTFISQGGNLYSDTTYIYALGDGDDIIGDYVGTNKLVFGEGILPEDILFSKQGNDLLLVVRQGGSIIIQGAFYNNEISSGIIDQIEFFNGDVWSADQIADTLLGAQEDVLPPSRPTAIFNSTGTVITGNAEAGSRVSVKNTSNVEVGFATAAVNGTYTIALATPLINKESVTVTATDIAGNTSSAATAVAPDKVAPSLPTATFDLTGKIITGVAEAGSSVIVKNTAGTQLGSVVANVTSGAYSITLAAALINKETVNVTATDTAGNISPVKVIVAPDKTAPSAPTAAFDSLGSIVSGIAEAGSTVIVKNTAGTQLGTTVANATNGAYSITLSTALINKETVNVTAVDIVGNVSIAKAIVAPDWVAPSAPTAVFNTLGKVITGVAEAGSTVIVKNTAGTQLGSVVANVTSGAYSITLATALINKETVNVTATDAAGNISPVNAIIAPDKTAPLAPTAAFDSGGKVISGVAEAGSTVVVKNTGGTQLGTVVANATTGAYSITLATALINKETVSVTATDAAGNISAVKAVIAPDKTAPSAPTAAFDAAGKVITGVAEAGSTVVVKNAGGTQLGTVVANVTSGAYTITLATALINKETVNVTATDVAGNISAVKAIIAPDKTAPSAPTAAFDAAGKVITGVAEAGSTVVVKNTSGTQLGTVVANATTGAYTITLATALINKQTVNVTAKDTAGNVSAVRAIIAPDKTAPSAPTAAFDTAGKVITGVAEAGSTVVVKNTGGTQLGAVVANATSGAYTITLATALINKETVNVTATDVAGNISAIKAIIAPDKTAPSAPTAAFDAAGKVITGVAEAGSTVVVKNTSGTQLGTVVANATTGAYSITLATALINKQTVNVTAKDVAGNVSAVRAIIAPDKTAPSAPTAAFDAAGKVITGVAEVGSTVVVKNTGGTQLGTVVANATNGSYSITLVTALTNKQTVNVTATDTAGNVSAAKAIVAPLIAPVSVAAPLRATASLQMDNLIQSMASFAPPVAAETKLMSAHYDTSQSVIAVYS